MAGRTLQIVYTADSKQVLAAQKQIDAGHSRMQTGIAKVGGTIKSTFGTLMPYAIGLSAAAIAGFAVDSVKAAVEANAAHLKLANTFRNNAMLADSSVDAFERQADALRDLTGVDDEAIKGAQALLGQFKLTGTQVSSLIPLIVDLSAKMGIDLESAAKAVGKATQGTTAGLQRYGIQVDKTRAQTDAFGATMEALGKVEGFAAARAEAEPWRVLGQQFEELKETIGAELLPLIGALTEGLSALVQIVANPTPWDQARLTQEAFGQAWAKWIEVAKVEAPEALHAAALGMGGVSQEMQIMAQAAEAGIDDWEGLLKLHTELGIKLEELVPTYEANRVMAERWTAAAKASSSQTETLTTTTDELAQANREAADAEREHRQATLALTDSFVGILDSADQVAEAQKELNRLERAGKDDTKAYEQAVRDAIGAQAGLEAAVVSYAQDLVDAGQKQRDVRAKVRELADQFGIQKGAVDDLIARVMAYIRALDGIPDRVHTTVVTDYWTPGQGRPPEMQHGGIVTRPTLALIGEAGPEAVVPLSRFGSRTMGTTNVIVYVQGSVVTERELAESLRSQLSQIASRNGGSLGVKV